MSSELSVHLSDDKLLLCITDVELSWAAELNRISILVLFLVIGGSVHQKV